MILVVDDDKNIRLSK